MPNIPRKPDENDADAWAAYVERETGAEHSDPMDDPEFAAWCERDRAARDREAAAELATAQKKRADLQSTLERFTRAGQPVHDEAPAGVGLCSAPPERIHNATPAGDLKEGTSEAKRSASPATRRPPHERRALTANPRKLSYYRANLQKARAALHLANDQARRDCVAQLQIPRVVFDVLQDISDTTDGLAGALDWVRRAAGPAVALEVEACGLYRVPGGRQIDDWSCQRARRKVALLVFALMSPFELKRSDVTGSTSDEPVLVTAGVPQTLLVKLLRPGVREPYSIRTLQRDLAEIAACSDILLRWRTPIAHAQEFEKRGREHGVVNRYCVRAGMIRDQWRRARDAGQALVKGTMLRLASWMVWRPAPAKGSIVPLHAGAPS